MKLFYILLGISLLTLAGGSFYYTNIQKKDAPLAVTPGTPQQEELIYIYREYGDISFKNKSATTFTSVNDTKMTIANDATVKTGNGRGYVIFPDNSSISLSTSTEIVISYEPTKVSIMQLIGSTYHRVTSLATGNKYEIRTPNTLAAIRGTKLAVTYYPKTKKTYVAVTENKVEVTPTKEDGTITKAPVMVQEGSLADIQSTSTPKSSTSASSTVTEKMVMRTNDEVKEMRVFIEENKIIDTEFDKALPEKRRELLEKIINILQKEEGTTETIPTNTSGIGENKPVTRTEILKRTVKEVTTIQPKETSSTPKIEQTTPPKATAEEVPTKTVTQPVVQVIPEARTLRSLPSGDEEFTTEEEAFVDAFYSMYEKYFFVDEPSAYCKRLGAVTAKDMQIALSTISNKAGFILPKQAELAAFANELVSACADGSINNKASTFKTRFDVTYPY